MITNKTVKKYSALLLLFTVTFFSSCSSNEEDTTASLADGKSTVITDLAGDT